MDENISSYVKLVEKLNAEIEPQDFFAEAIEAVGLTGHPKASKAFSLAYDYGHSSGYLSVLNYLDEIANLLRD
jgi:hypothetical protein